MVVVSGYVDDCSCPKTDCPRHGKCCECVAYHRDGKKNLPVCLRSVVTVKP